MTVASEDDSTPVTAQHELRTFGRRRGRGLSPRQQRLIDQELPRLRLDFDQPPSWPLNQKVWLEIGFGGAEHLIAQAEANPGIAFIGCEPFQEGIVKALTAIEERKLANVRLYDGDAREVLRWLPEGCLSRVFVLFPDPWPKRRHAKRRLVSPATLSLIADRMAVGGELRIATDIAQYARTVLAAVSLEPRLTWLAQRAADWRNRTDDWPETRYEAKALRAGRRCTYFRFRRTALEVEKTIATLS